MILDCMIKIKNNIFFKPNPNEDQLGYMAELKTSQSNCHENDLRNVIEFLLKLMWLVRIFRRLLGTLLLHKPHVHICCQQDKSVTGLPEGLPGSGCALPFIELELPCPADFLHSDAGVWKYLVALYMKNNFNRWNRKGYNTVACWLMCMFPALSFFFYHCLCIIYT